MLNKIKEKMVGAFKNSVDSKKSIGLAIFAGLLLIVAYYVFKTYLYPKLNPTYVSNKEFQQSQDKTVETRKEPDIAKIYYFYTQWCPFCKKARPEWDKFVEYVNNINTSETYDFEIITSVVDCDKQTSIADKYEIEGYPTIKLIKNKEIYEYDAKPNKEHLIEFLKSYIE